MTTNDVTTQPIESYWGLVPCGANLWFGGFPYPVNPGRPEWSKVQTQLERGVEDINWGLNPPPPNPYPGYSHTAKTVTLSLKFKRSSDQYNSLDAYHLHKKSLFQLLNLAIFTTLSLNFNLLAVPALRLLSIFLALQPSPP